MERVMTDNVTDVIFVTIEEAKAVLRSRMRQATAEDSDAVPCLQGFFAAENILYEEEYQNILVLDLMDVEDKYRESPHVSKSLLHTSTAVYLLARSCSTKADYYWGYQDILTECAQSFPAFREHMIRYLRSLKGPNQIPVWMAFREGRYDRCPSMGRTRTYDSDQLLNGIVVPYLGKRYLLRFNWKALTSVEFPKIQSVHPGSVPEASILFEETNAPLTKQVNSNNQRTWNSLRVFGRGYSQQQPCCPSLNGRPPSCLCVFETGEDFTWTVMVNLDDHGMPIMAWLEGSCT